LGAATVLSDHAGYVLHLGGFWISLYPFDTFTFLLGVWASGLCRSGFLRPATGAPAEPWPSESPEHAWDGFAAEGENPRRPAMKRSGLR
jgi:hypothetical protein